MKTRRLSLFAVLCCASLCLGEAEARSPEAVIVCEPGTSRLTEFAAREVRRYVYLRTGALLPIAKRAGRKDAIVLAVQGAPGTEIVSGTLGSREYVLKTVAMKNDRQTLYLVGGSETAVLYGAYRFAEHLGVRFYLHGDVLPDRQSAFSLPQLNEKRSPLFDLRGIQPFHDFPEGPDWWNADEYKAIIAQLPKLGMNFIGLHTYPLAEPTVWSGLARDIAADGRVKKSYPTSYLNTGRTVGFGFDARKTSEYACGASAFFDRDDYGADVMRGLTPQPDSPEKCNELFDRTGAMLNDAFSFAQQFGVKTCVGTETPLAMPGTASEQLGNDPNSVRKVYEGIFTRIMRAYPVDYYWLWTPEGWTWEGTTPEQVQNVLTDITTARQALANVAAPFGLATCGWVLGPQYDRALLGKRLPSDVAVSCISRAVGYDPVDPGFADVLERDKWAIPWLEDDPAMTSPQLWVGRMRRDARDALKYGCTGLMGIHWRTRILGPNVSALAASAWQQDAAWSLPAAQSGVIGGMTTRFAEARVDGADDNEVYQYYRYGMSAYRIVVPNGAYGVTLKMAEPAFPAVGKRVFGVSIEGKKVLDKLDIFARSGYNKAFDCTFDGIEVKDGCLDIDFEAGVEFTCIAGLVVKGNGVDLKINCGGPAHGAYQADLSSETGHVSADDFYADWALYQFGPEIAGEAARIFGAVDGKLPQPSTWAKGPGGYVPDESPWSLVAPKYAFVEELAALQTRVQGPNNTERFNYWLDTMRYLRATARMRCVWADYNAALKKVEALADSPERKHQAKKVLLPLRKTLVATTEEAYRHLMATVSTTGEMGTLANLEGHTFPVMLDAPGKQLEQLLGEPLPADANMDRAYTNAPRIVVTAPRTSLCAGDPLNIRVIVASAEGPASVTLYWRPLGRGKYRNIPLARSERHTYNGTVPAKSMKSKDIEYYIEAKIAGSGRAGETCLLWPPAAPKLNQTVTLLRLNHPAK